MSERLNDWMSNAQDIKQFEVHDASWNHELIPIAARFRVN